MHYNFLKFSTIILCFLSSLKLLASQPIGKISLVKGEVFILNGDKQIVADTAGKRARHIKKDAPFFEGETIQTKIQSRVKLVFEEGGNEVVLSEDTSLLISRAGSKTSGTELKLSNGTVRSSVYKKYSGEGTDVFEVTTPNSVAGVRGTTFQVSFDRKSSRTMVYTEKGKVAVQSMQQNVRQAEVEVTAGQFSEVSREKTPSFPKKLEDKSKNDFKLIKPESEDQETDVSSSPQDANTSESPKVSLAPKAVDSMKTETPDNRAPASLNSESKANTNNSSEATLMPNLNNNSSSLDTITTIPTDKIQQRSESMRRQSEEQVRQQRSQTGTTTGARVEIK